MLNVLLLGQAGLVRQGLAQLLRESDLVEGVHEATTVEEWRRVIRTVDTDVALLYASGPVAEWETVLRRLRADAAAVPVVVLFDWADEQTVLTAMRAGAAGCVDKGVDLRFLCQSLVDAVGGKTPLSDGLARRLARSILGGNRDGREHRHPDALTAREREILRLVSMGLTNRQIAARIFVSESTVRAHLRTVNQKMGVNNRVHAVSRALTLGILQPPDREEQPLEGNGPLPGGHRYSASAV